MMHTVELIDASGAARAYRLPGSWEDCTVDQLATMALLMSAGLEYAQDKEMSEVHMRLRLLHELTGMSNAEFDRLATADLLELRPDPLGADRVALLPQLDWALKPPVWQRSLLPTVTVRGVVYSGPRDGLARMSLHQWGFCDALAQRLGNDAAPDALANLLGALYHRQGEAWDNDGIEERGQELAQLDARTQLAAALNYRGLRGGLAVRYPRCFRGTGGESDPRGMQGMVVRMASPKFGTVAETYRADLHDVMVHVEQSMEEADRMKAQTRR